LSRNVNNNFDATYNCGFYPAFLLNRPGRKQEKNRSEADFLVAPKQTRYTV
jgi:hypothetical protein